MNGEDRSPKAMLTDCALSEAREGHMIDDFVMQMCSTVAIAAAWRPQASSIPRRAK